MKQITAAVILLLSTKVALCQDTLKTETLKEVRIILGAETPTEVRSQTPVQVVSDTDIEPAMNKIMRRLTEKGCTLRS